MAKRLFITTILLLIGAYVFGAANMVEMEEYIGKWITEDGKETWEFEHVNPSDGLVTITNQETGEVELYGWDWMGNSTIAFQFAHQVWTLYWAVWRPDGSIYLTPVHRYKGGEPYVLRKYNE